MCNESESETIVNRVAELLDGCESLLFITGAGISADSGLPTYRGIGGLYDVEETEEGFPIEEILSGPMLAANPELTWKYLKQIADATRGAHHNRAHEVIAEMESRFPCVWTLTQNVDGFHRDAGSSNVIEIHGNLRSLSCLGCGKRRHVDVDQDIEFPPRCTSCNELMRPDVVLFGEMLPVAAVDQLTSVLATGFDIVFSVGTSAMFPYIQEPLVLGRRMGIPTVEINPGETVLSDLVEYRIPQGAATALDQLWTAFQAQH